MASLWFLDREPRLEDLLASWVISNGALLSVQRLRNVAHLFPDVAKDRVNRVARLAVERGRDFRWKPLVRHEVSALVERPGKKLSIAVPLERPSAVMLRLRALLGVGMRADVISYMASADTDFVTADDVAKATAYNGTAIRRLLVQLANAGGLHSDRTSTITRYSIRGSLLAHVAVKRPSAKSRWRFTAQVFAAVTEFLEWRRTTRRRTVSPFAVAVKGDELFDKYEWALVAAGAIARGSALGVQRTWPHHFTVLAEWLQAVI